LADIVPVAGDSHTENVETEHLRRWQWITLALMFLGYAGYYMCRVHLSVATPLLIDAFKAQGVDKKAIGHIVSIGTLFYACGKFINGSLVDFLGGRRMFLLGMAGAIIATVWFGGSSTIPMFTMAWALNRALQSTGWAGTVRISSRWFGYSTYGAAMGVLSLSFLLGDSVWRLALGGLNHLGVGWRGLFYISAAGLGLIFIVNMLFLKESPRQIGEAEPPINPVNLFGEAGREEKPANLIALLLPLLRSPLFWIVCALSFGFTLLRETFNTWTPQYLHEVAKMPADAAGAASSFFPFCGAISTLLCGFFADRLGLNGRATLILIGLGITMPLLLLLGYADFGHSQMLTLLLLGAIAFCVLGPYTFLAGAIALDFGGKRGSATASGWIDGVGYIASIYAGEGVGALAEKYGWSHAFGVLTGIAAVSCMAAIIYWIMQGRAAKLAAESILTSSGK
jgi:OPA family glycerol-3-phosphate transporter-like MFS transporter